MFSEHRIEVRGDKKGNKVMDREINHKGSGRTRFSGDSVSEIRLCSPGHPPWLSFTVQIFLGAALAPVSTRPLTKGQGKRRRNHRLGPEITEAATSPTSRAGRTWKVLHKDRPRPELVPA